MIRKDKERGTDFAWEVLEKADYVTLALSDSEGKPYCIPITVAADRAYNAIYFHCAKIGLKMDILRQNSAVCLSAVGSMASVPRQFTLNFTSAVFRGHAEEVTDESEKVKALLLICTKYDPKGMDRFDGELDKYLPATGIVKITPEEITGKESVH